MCFDESVLWVHVHRKIRNDEKHVSSFEMGRGGAKGEHVHLLERLGFTCHAGCLDVLVRNFFFWLSVGA